MKKLEKLDKIFVEVFSCKEEELGPDFNKDNVGIWDSVHQLSLTSSIEDDFDIMLDVEDIIGCTSYEAVKEILAKYEIEL